jgi:tRNA(fMet)-specific endonuclease VapC
VILLDTNICIYVMRRRPVDVFQRFDATRDSLSVSIITVAELEYGVERSAHRTKNARALDEFLAMLAITPWDRACAKQYAKVRAATQRQPIGAEDTMIAACALAHDALLVTNNEREFRRVPKLKVENWVSA